MCILSALFHKQSAWLWTDFIGQIENGILCELSENVDIRRKWQTPFFEY